MEKLRPFLLVFFIFIIVQKLSAQCSPPVYSGQATYYTYNGGGNCSFPDPYSTLYSAAVNASQYTNAQYCGACAQVTGERGTIIVSLEDQCPECLFGDLDLESEAFPKIADPVKGRVPIKWKIVPCPVTGPIQFYFKEGSNQWWTAVQVRNHRFPIKKFEYLKNGVFVEIPRVSYNYFLESSGMGTGPFTFRVTDTNGKSITESNIPFKLTTPIAGTKQFPTCSAPTGDGLIGQYYKGKNFETLAMTRKDTSISFNWGSGSPHTSVPVDNFSVRWTGQIKPKFSQTYTFYIKSDNGRRLWVNNKLIIDKWINDWQTTYEGSIALVAGTLYDIKIEYFEQAGGANCKLEWSSSSQPRMVVPKSQLYSSRSTASMDEYLVEVEQPSVKNISKINAWPNPANDKVALDWSEFTLEPVKLKVIDITGYVVKEISVIEASVDLNVADFNSGIYWIKIENHNSSTQRKLLIRR